MLLAYAKQSLTDALLASSLPDSAYLERDLRAYFPPQVVERFGSMLNEHPLRRELIAMLVANDVVNSQGVTFVSRVVTETGAEAADVTRAYRIARDVTGAVERWEEIEALVGSLEPPLLDELMLLVHPLLLGGGKSLFEGVKDFRRLKMTRCEPTRDGRALLVYQT